ncbi:MAG: hypothetical protein HQ567_18805 [Candidatus Nealsonbacteria bacterium]|nr:hypothetical protein [Candidatus Nealsonbacteria bacterium]
MSQQNEQPAVQRDRRQPFQLTLTQLMIFTLWWISICVIGTCFGWGLGILFVVSSLIGAGLSVRRTRRASLAVLLLTVLLLLAAAFLPAVPQTR